MHYTTNFNYFGVISNDGKNFKELYDEEFIVSNKANGIGLIPFRDGKTIYLGGFILGCNDMTNNISSCEKRCFDPSQLSWNDSKKSFHLYDMVRDGSCSR